MNFKTPIHRLAGVACCPGTGKRAIINPAAPLLSARYQFMVSENEIMIIPAAASNSGLPGGYRNNNGNFNNLGNNANFWSASENDANNAWNRNLNYDNANVNRNNNNKQNGFSIRLLRDLWRLMGPHLLKWSPPRRWRPLTGIKRRYAVNLVRKTGSR